MKINRLFSRVGNRCRNVSSIFSIITDRYWKSSVFKFLITSAIVIIFVGMSPNPSFASHMCDDPDCTTCDGGGTCDTCDICHHPTCDPECPDCDLVPYDPRCVIISEDPLVAESARFCACHATGAAGYQDHCSNCQSRSGHCCHQIDVDACYEDPPRYTGDRGGLCNACGNGFVECCTFLEDEFGDPILTNEGNRVMDICCDLELPSGDVRPDGTISCADADPAFLEVCESEECDDGDNDCRTPAEAPCDSRCNLELNCVPDECNYAEIVCDENGVGECVKTPRPAGTACGDQSDTDCDNPDTCDAEGVCQENLEVDETPCTDDGNICTDDYCVSGACEHPNNTDPCDDGDACTTNDTCAAGQCAGGPPPDCDDSNICTDDYCNSETGCVNDPNTDPCDDGDACTTEDTCADGTCVGGPPLVCNDENICTDDSCNSETGCVYTPNTDPCDDGDACTTEDTCTDGTCVGGPPPDCDDGNVCTDDSCDYQAGCLNTPNTDPCDDGNACTTADTCTDGACVGGPPPDCNDENVCTDDSCNSETGCVNTPNTDPCNDGNACTNGDICSGGQCVGGPPLVCDDENVCTDDSCDLEIGCVYTPNIENSCSDEDVCNGLETCNEEGICDAGEPLDCNDDIDCTNDSCDPAVGCLNDPDDTLCDDGDECTDDSCDPEEGCISSVDKENDLDEDGVRDNCDICPPAAFVEELSVEEIEEQYPKLAKAFRDQFPELSDDEIIEKVIDHLKSLETTANPILEDTNEQEDICTPSFIKPAGEEEITFETAGGDGVSNFGCSLNRQGKASMTPKMGLISLGMFLLPLISLGALRRREVHVKTRK